VIAFFPSAKDLFEVAAAICGGHSRKQKARLIEVFGNDLRRTLDSDGDRWGSRMRVVVQLESKPELYDELLAFAEAQIAAAEESGDGKVNYEKLQRLLRDPRTRFEFCALNVLFGQDMVDLLGASQSSQLTSFSFAEWATIGHMVQR
jgi:hypothetical protein